MRKSFWNLLFCGKRGIRTLGTVARSPHFECGPFDHSGIFPYSSAIGKTNTTQQRSAPDCGCKCNKIRVTLFRRGAFFQNYMV